VLRIISGTIKKPAEAAVNATAAETHRKEEKK
jgi:hypothetical protein